MKVDFDEFSEMVERACFNSWRSVVGVANGAVIDNVDSILLTRSEGERWAFSFALRVDGRWSQSKVEVEPLEYDPFAEPDPNDVEASMSPMNRASSISIELLSDVARKAGAKNVGQ